MTQPPTTFPQTYHVQFSFHFDETQRLLEVARGLPDERYRASNGYSRDGLHTTFVHLLSASRLWRNVIANTPVPPLGEDIADSDALVSLFEAERTGWLDLLATLDEAALLTTIERQSPWGVLVLPVWQTLQHVILHGVLHQAELARMLTDAGRAPGDIDFLLYQPTA